MFYQVGYGIFFAYRCTAQGSFQPGIKRGIKKIASCKSGYKRSVDIESVTGVVVIICTKQQACHIDHFLLIVLH
jgi:hypothetical protein